MKRSRTRRRFDSPEQEAYLSLWRTYDRLRAIEEACFAKFDLTAQQYNVLRLVKAAAPESVPASAILARLVSRAPDVTRMIDKLEASGWIVRIRSESDRRNVHLAMTPAGLKLIAKIAEPLAECQREQLGHMSAMELAVLTELLHKARSPHEPPNSPWRDNPEDET
jgi:DNA-binding MarR family transcriptional regulator